MIPVPSGQIVSFEMDAPALDVTQGLTLAPTPSNGSIFYELFGRNGALTYGSLSCVLALLKGLAEIHQNAHWTASSDPYYGDHLLFERLYGDVIADVDVVAEKAIGVGGTELVDLRQLIHDVEFVISSLTSGSPLTIPRKSGLAAQCLEAEMMFLDALDAAFGVMEDKGEMTRGISNMLEGIYDKAEGRIYLLKQRVGSF